MNTRDCPHGRMVAKCADCDVIELEADNNALRALNAELVGALREIVSQIDQGGSSGKVFARDYCITAAREALAKVEAGK